MVVGATLMRQKRESGCVNDEPYGTVLYSLFHARRGSRDDRPLRVHC